FQELETIGYKYTPTNNSFTSSVPSAKAETKSEVAEEIQQLREEIQNLKQEKKEESATVAQQDKPKAIDETPKNPNTTEAKKEFSGVLYAQAIDNGFQLVDSSPKVVYKIKNTSMENVFLVEGKNATLYKKGDVWILEYYDNDVLKQEELNIKF